MQRSPDPVTQNHPVIFYDGECGLCDRSVRFIIRHDQKRLFRYATLQSEIARQVLGSRITFDSFILYADGKVFYRSAAALRTLRLLGGWSQFLYVFIIIPPFIRNAVYDWIARNRYRWFGKPDQCRIPSPEEKALFLD